MSFNHIKDQNYIFSKLLQPMAIILFFMSIQRGLFETVGSLNARYAIGWYEYLQIYLMGFRFDLLILSFMLLPIFFLLFLKVGLDKKILVTKFYLSTACAVIFFFNFINMPYFGLYQKLINYPEWKSLNLANTFSAWIVGQGTFLKSMLLIFVIFTFILALIEIYKMDEVALDNEGLDKRKETAKLLVCLLILAFSARGKVGVHHLRREDSFISSNSSWNELALNAQWSFNKDDR